MDANHRPHTLSRETRARLESDVAELRVRRQRMAAELDSGRGTVGDSGDAADALERADEVAALDRRIAELEAVLGGWAPVSKRAGMLPDGTELTLRFPDSGLVTMRVVNFAEEVPADEEDTTLSPDSPLGLAAAQHRPGDTFTYQTPQGPMQVELVSVKEP
ncbi:MAG: GreA/GreB family elongation factor [Rhodococcus sp. (in: high G+C Gram-positive bacteria)]|uniref:GreA/GreB family elongation factor n=1 Tax=Rhodococcus sp. TaxID=1831 RepID=UPI003BB03D06